MLSKKQNQSNLTPMFCNILKCNGILLKINGTRGRTRTGTLLRASDFESDVSTNFTTLAIFNSASLSKTRFFYNFYQCFALNQLVVHGLLSFTTLALPAHRTTLAIFNNASLSKTCLFLKLLSVLCTEPISRSRTPVLHDTCASCASHHSGNF